MKVRILDAWEMELPEPTDDPWFVDWVARSPKQAGDHLAVSWKTFCALAVHCGPDAFPTVQEYFGGIGAHALMLENLFEPIRHWVNDYSLEAVVHMQRVLPEEVKVCQADSYNLDASSMADLQVLDFGDLTVWKAHHDPRHSGLLDHVFHLKPAAVTITDIAARYLHLQKGVYEPILGDGTCDTYESYLDAFADYMHARFGYVLLEGNYTRWSCVMAFVPEGTAQRGTFNKAHTMSGLVLV